MTDTKPNQDNQTAPQAPKMVKPVTGTFKQARRKLTGMVKNARKSQQGKGDK